MGGVAHQHHRVGVPGVHGVDVVDGADVHTVHVQAAGNADDALVEAFHRLQEVFLGDAGRPGAVRVEGGDVERHLVAVAQRQQVDLGALADVHPQVVIHHHAVG